MANAHSPTCVFQETRLNLDAPGPVVHVALDGAQATISPRDSPKRRKLDRSSSPQDEATYTASHFATDGSVYFRSVEDSSVPSTLLWRVLDNGTTLELQAVNLSTPTKTSQPAPSTLRFSLPHAIIPSGVLLTQPKKPAKSDTLVICIFTQRPDLYKLTLKKEAFTHPTYFQDDNIRSQWFSKCTPSILSYRQPYRAFATDADELWISLNDGGLVRLQWDAQSSYKWAETRFAEGNWKGSFMSMIRRSQPMVKFGNVDLDARSAASIIQSPSGKLVWTACLDHTLRAWDIETGKTVFLRDLAGDEDRDLARPFEQPLEAQQPHLLQLEAVKVKSLPWEYQLIVYSPLTQSFLFWIVDESDYQQPDVRRYHSGLTFAPPVDDLLNVSGWRLEQYSLTAPKDGRSHHWDLWLLVRCAGKSNVLTLRFSPVARASENQATWQGGWSTVFPGSGSVEELRKNINNPQETDQETTSVQVPSVTEQWVDFIFSPGRFTSDLLEIALGIYRRGQSKSTQSSLISSRASLMEEVCSTVGAASVMQTSAVVRENFMAYEKDIATQWNIFYGVVQDLQKQKERPINLAYEAHNGMAWIISADQVAPVRSSSILETLWQNPDAFGEFHPTKQSHNQAWESLSWREGDADAGKLLRALRIFTDSLPKSFLIQLHELVVTDFLFSPRSDLISHRMQKIYDKSDFDQVVSDEDYDTVANALELIGGFERMTNAPFDVLIHALTVETGENASEGGAVAPYGLKVLSQGAQDILQTGQDILAGIIAFSIFTAIDLDPNEVSSDFAADEVYLAAGPLLLEHSLLHVLTSTPVDDRNHTLLEDIAGVQTKAGHVERTSVTKWIRQWTFSLIMNGDLGSLATNVLAHMVKRGQLFNAELLFKYMPADSWSCYIKGRYYLSIGEAGQAAEEFVNAAEGLSTGFDAKTSDVANLLTTLEHLHFGEGLLSYYQHILNQFEKDSHPSYVVDFAKLALEHAEPNDRSATTARTDILSRLFTASVATQRFDEAFAALTAYTDSALRRSALSTLLNNLIAASRISQLTSLSFSPDLAAAADAHLAHLASTPDALLIALSTSTLATYDADAPLLPAYQILYAFRSSRGDFRGAAEALWEHIQHLRVLRAQGLRSKELDAEISETYLGCINAMCLVEESMRWLLVRPVVLPASRVETGLRGRARPDLRNKYESTFLFDAEDVSREKRALVSLADVRSEWQRFLDWQADLAAGRYALGLDDIHEDEEMQDEVEGGAWEPLMLGGLAPPGAMEDDPFVA